MLTFTLPVAPGRLTGAEQTVAFYRDLLERLSAVPRILSASVSVSVPLRNHATIEFAIAGRPASDPARRPHGDLNFVTPNYHRTLGVRIARGRAFSDADRSGSVPVALVNETFVRQYLAGADPLNERVIIEVAQIEQLRSRVERQIVGVYADVRSDGSRTAAVPAVDLPFWQVSWPQTTVAVRTAGDPMTVRHSIGAVVQALDPDLPMGDVKTMEQIVSESMAADRFNTVLFGSFAGIALLLAAVGIYGVMAFAVAQRTHEIGLRMALGAGRRRIIAQVLREGMATTLIGMVFGSLGAYFVARSMRGIVQGVGAVDPTAYIAVTLALVGSALVACLVPAARAASVDPMIALRRE